MKTKNTLILLLLVFTSSIFYGQKVTKYTKVLSNQIDRQGTNENYSVWIFFKDKGNNIKSKLQTSKIALTEASIKRRKKLFKNEDYVTFYDIPVEKSYINQITPFITKIRHQSKWLNAVSVEINGTQLKNIAALPFVKSLDVIRVRKYGKELPTIYSNPSTKSTKSTAYTLNYGSSITQLEQINVPFVHDMGYSGDGLIICVLDSGFNNLEHQSFDSMNIIDSYDFVNDDNNVDDEGDMGTGDHGTMTLSTIGGFYEGQLIGPAYGASYLLAKTENTDSETQVEEDNWVAGAEWAEALGAEITSTSLGYIDFDDGSFYDASELDGNTATITIAADIMASLGVLVVNSAGNSGSGTTTIGAPADGDEVLAVGAVTASGTRSSFSSVGPTGDGRIKPEVMAMGSGVKVAGTSGNSYENVNGTSFSCPLTAGAAALLWEMVPSASNMEIFEALKMTADNASSPNNEYGWGIIDVYAAYQYFTPKITTIPLANTESFTGPYTVTADIISTTALVGSPKLYYRTNAGAWTELTMTLTSGDTYTASIPGTGSQAVYDYYIIAENNYALVSLPIDAPTSYYTFSASQAPEIIHEAIAENYLNLWGTTAITTEFIDVSGIDESNSFIEWKINGTTQSPISFAPIGGDTFVSNFPSIIDVLIGDLIEYRLVAQDLSPEQNISYHPTSGFHSFLITDRISFEQNQFSHTWNFEGDADWFVTDFQAQDGSFSMRAGAISHSESSSISISFSNDVAGNISFYKKVDSEGTYDFLKFYINDNLEMEWSGTTGWSEQVFPISAGNHTLKWEYVKDSSVSDGDDTAWIDNISFPGDTTIGNQEFISEIAGVYPNPALNSVYINLNELQNVNISIYTVAGKLVKNIDKYASNSRINLENVKNGLYVIKIKSNNTTQFVKLIIAK